MAKKFNQPIRMCIVCRQRDIQSNFTRLQCDNSQLSLFSGEGRSFYICLHCLDDEKKVLKSLMRQCKSGDKEKLMSKLKEMITNE